MEETNPIAIEKGSCDEKLTTQIHRFQHIRRKKWTQQEEQLLFANMYKLCINNHCNSSKAAKQIHDTYPQLGSTRRIKEKIEYWLDDLRPKPEWTNQDDDLLMSLVESHGRKWRYISIFFRGASDYTVRNRYCTLMKNRDFFEIIDEKQASDAKV